MAKIATNSNFAEILASDKPIMVDFWAVWCGPCRMLSPTVDDIAEQYEGKVEVVKCNVDDCQDIAIKYGIRSIPTLIFFKNGEIAKRTVGVVSEAEIKSILEELL
ncbi:MAG: thioredoxin [Bacteroidales bacterium]|nr:thioredoxin [Bacteroidales bacterium]MBQ2090281.1 thioredoxin [Bacteroidales bacterium]